MKKKRLYYERKTIQITLVIIESHGVLIINLYNTNYIRLFSCVGHIRCIIFTPRHTFLRAGHRLIGNKFIIESLTFLRDFYY